MTTLEEKVRTNNEVIFTILCNLILKEVMLWTAKSLRNKIELSREKATHISTVGLEKIVEKCILLSTSAKVIETEEKEMNGASTMKGAKTVSG